LLVSDVIDRTYSEWLYPAGIDRPIFDTVKTVGVLSGTTEGTFEIDGRIANIPRDSLVEIGSELILIKLSSGVAPTVVLTTSGRGYLESAAVSHSVGDKVFVDPKYPRIQVFNAIVSAIGSLYPLGLYLRSTDSTQTFDVLNVKALPTGGKKIISPILVRRSSSYEQYDKLWEGEHFEEFDEFTPPKFQLRSGGAVGQPMVITYQKDFTLPTVESDDLSGATIAVPVTLQPYLPMAVAGYLLQGKDLPKAAIEEIRRILAQQAGASQVGTSISIGRALIQTFEQKYVTNEVARLHEVDPPRMILMRH
jgi:hypothetical protein